MNWNELDKSQKAEFCCRNHDDMKPILAEIEKIEAHRKAVEGEKRKLIKKLLEKHKDLVPKMVSYQGRTCQPHYFSIDDYGCLRVSLTPVKKDGTPLYHSTIIPNVNALFVTDLRDLVLAIAGIEL